MGIEFYTETTCERCGKKEREEDSIDCPPANWVNAQFWHSDGQGYATHEDRLLCPKCVNVVRGAMSKFEGKKEVS